MTKDFPYPVGFYITRTQREMQKHFLRKAKKYRLTPEQFVILMRLSEKEGISFTELSKVSFCEKSYTTRLVEKLEKKGFVRREANPNDKRSYLLFITKQGETLKKEVLPSIFKINEWAMEKLSEEETSQLKFLLNKIYDHIKD